MEASEVQAWLLAEIKDPVSKLLLLDPPSLQESGPILAKLMINEIFPRLAADETDIADVEFYHPGMTELIGQCVAGLHHQILTKRHVRKIIEDTQFWWHASDHVKGTTGKYACWDLLSYLRDTNLLDEAGGDELLKIVLEVMAANPKAVTELKSGKDKAIGALVGAVMKKQKADPSAVQTLIRQHL